MLTQQVRVLRASNGELPRSVAMVALMKMPAHLPTGFGSEAIDWSERRMFPRKEIHATVQSTRHDNTLDARQLPRLNLMLRDLSLGGLSAICDHPLKQGEQLTVFFPRSGMLNGWDAFGRVLRCDPSGLGYRVAVEFDPLPAA
jgi:hypothetical protein